MTSAGNQSWFYLQIWYPIFKWVAVTWQERVVTRTIVPGMATKKPELLKCIAIMLLDYSQISNISCTKSQNLNVSCLTLQMSLCNLLKQVLSREWKCSWSSVDRRCSNFIWVISKFIAYYAASYIRGLMVCSKWTQVLSWTKWNVFNMRWKTVSGHSASTWVQQLVSKW